MKRILRIVGLVVLLLCGCSFMKGSEVEVQPEQTAAPVATLAPEDYVVPDFTEEEKEGKWGMLSLISIFFYFVRNLRNHEVVIYYVVGVKRSKALWRYGR